MWRSLTLAKINLNEDLTLNDLKPRELTPNQMISYYQAKIRSEGKEEEDIANALVTNYLLPDMDLDFLACVCGVDRAEIDKAPGSELVALAEQAKTTNPLFFAMKQRIEAKSKITSA